MVLTDCTDLRACRVQRVLWFTMRRNSCKVPHCLSITAKYLLQLGDVKPVLNLNDGSVELYRASVHVKFSYISTALMGRTAFKKLRAHSLQLNIYSNYGCWGLYRAGDPVKNSYTSIQLMGRTECTELQCTYSLSIPLLPLWTVGV